MNGTSAATPKRPDRSRNGGSRPSTQKEGVRRSMTQWKFVTGGFSASDATLPLDEATPPVATRSEQRRLGTSQGSRGDSAPDSFVPQSPLRRPPQTACKAVRPTVAPLDAQLLASGNSSVTTNVAAGFIHSFASTKFATVDDAHPQQLLEYSPAMAAIGRGGNGVASSTVHVDIVAPVEEYRVKRENLSLKSVMNAATEAAEESCARAQPWSSEELGRRLLKLPDPVSQEPYPASVPIHPSTPSTAMTTRRGRSPPTSLRAPPENLGRCYPLAAGVDHSSKPAATHAVGTVVSSATVSPASAHNTTAADVKAAQRHLEQRKQQRAQAAILATTMTTTGTAGVLPQLTSSEPEALVLMVPADDDGSQAGERRVTFKADQRKSAGRRSPRKPREGPTSPASLAPSSRRGSTKRPTLASPLSSRVSSPSGASHAKVPASERSAGSSGGGESSKDWIAAGGVSKDEPLYKKMAVAIQDMKNEFGFVDENEIRAIDAVLLGLQHAHVHRMYGNLHSLRDVSSTFHETTTAPVKPMAPNLLTDTVQLPRAKRAAMDAGGRKRDIVMPRRATDAVEASRSARNQPRGTTEPQASSSSAAQLSANHRGQMKKAPPSWSKESERELRRRDQAHGQERALTARFLCHPSELKLEDGPTATTPGPVTPPMTPPLQSSSPRGQGLSRASSRATKPLDPFNMTDAQMEAFLAEKSVEAPDMEVFESNIAATPAIAGATQSITRFVEHLRRVMPPEDAIRYTQTSTPRAPAIPIGSV